MAKTRQAVRTTARKVHQQDRRMQKLSGLLQNLWHPGLFMLAVFLMVMVYVAQNLSLKQMWPVQSVKIEGEFKYLDKSQLRDRALPAVNGGLFSIDLESVRHALSDMPWVEDVSVRRQWPDQILIRVIEKQPVVYWYKDELLSAKGKLFKPQKMIDIDLPVLEGPEGHHQSMLQEMARMQAWLLDTGLYIQRMTLDARRSWSLTLTNGMQLRLGRQQVHERLSRFVNVYNDNLQSDRRGIQYVDMRYTNGFAVAWNEA